MDILNVWHQIQAHWILFSILVVLLFLIFENGVILEFIFEVVFEGIESLVESFEGNPAPVIWAKAALVAIVVFSIYMLVR